MRSRRGRRPVLSGENTSRRFIGQIMENWFEETQQRFIEENCEMIEFYAKDIALALRIRDKTRDEVLRLEIDDYVKFIEGYMSHLSQHNDFHERMIDEGRKRHKETAGRPHSYLVRNESGDKEKERTGHQADEQYSISGQGNGRIRPGGDDFDFWADKMRENPFRADIDL
jgi:hypothetical protein